MPATVNSCEWKSNAGRGAVQQPRARLKNAAAEFGRLLLGQGFSRCLIFLRGAFQLFQSLLRFR